MSDELIVNIKNSLRAALAISFAAWLCEWLSLHYAYWVILTTVVILQPSVGATLERAKLRILGTLLGVLMGAFLINVLHHEEFLVFATVVVLLFFALWLMFLNYTWSIFFATAALILILGMQSTNTWEFVRDRFYDTLIGVLIGLVFSLLLWPSWARLRLRENLLQSMGQVQELTELVLESLMMGDYQLRKVNEIKLSLGSALERNRQYFEETKHENISLFSRRLAAQAVLRSLERIRDIVFAVHGLRKSGLLFQEESENKTFLVHYQEVVDEIFTSLKSYLQHPGEQTEPSELIDMIELNKMMDSMPVLSNSYSLLYLKRNLDRILHEFNHLSQSLEAFYRFTKADIDIQA